MSSLYHGIISGERRRGFDEVAGRVAKIAHGLHQLGVRQGDSVCVLMRNDIAFIEVAYAAMRLGAYGVPVNWHFKPAEIDYVLRDAGAKVLVGHADMLHQLRDVLAPGVTVLSAPTPPEILATYNIDPEIAGLTEMQSGSYVFMDLEYRRIGGASGAVYEDFAPALCVLSTVVHRSGRKAIVDAGIKALATDRGFGPEVLGMADVTYEFAGDEHGRLILNDDRIRPGDRLRLIMKFMGTYFLKSSPTMVASQRNGLASVGRSLSSRIRVSTERFGCFLASNPKPTRPKPMRKF